MNFEHTEDRRMLEETLTRFLADKYDIETRNKIAYSEAGRSPELWGELSELGLIGALFSEDNGGFGGEGFDIMVVFEAIGRGLCPEPFLGALLTGNALIAAGESQAELLEGVISGEKIGSFAHEEEESHYELEHVATKAVKSADGWELNGVKSVVSHAQAADFFIVSGRESGDVADKDGIALFVVPKDAAGLTVRDYLNNEGGRSGEVILENVKVADTALVAKGPEALALLDKISGLAALALSAEALGIMEVIKTTTNEYLQMRKQFGVPIGKFQALQHRMVEMVMEIEQVRSSVINAATMPKNYTERAKLLTAAKMTACGTGTLVTEEAIQMHGGIGMTWEYGMAHYAKRLTMIGHQFGDEDYHLARYIELSQSA
ncbi:MAG: acyl-CoA dehydrogenase family protein [Methyloligellaceae bacterium]